MLLSLAQIATFKAHVRALDRLMIQADSVNTAELSIALARLVHTGEGDTAALLDVILKLRERAEKARSGQTNGQPVMDRLIALTKDLETDVRAADRGGRQ